MRIADIPSNPFYRHFELRNRKSYQVGSVQGKEIEKSENICSTNKSGKEIPNDKNNIFQTFCIWDGHLIKKARGSSSTWFLFAISYFQNCDLGRHSLSTPSIRDARENLLGFWEKLTLPAYLASPQKVDPVLPNAYQGDMGYQSNQLGSI